MVSLIFGNNQSSWIDMAYEILVWYFLKKKYIKVSFIDGLSM